MMIMGKREILRREVKVRTPSEPDRLAGSPPCPSRLRLRGEKPVGDDDIFFVGDRSGCPALGQHSLCGCGSFRQSCSSLTGTVAAPWSEFRPENAYKLV